MYQSSHEEFVRLLLLHQKDLFRYIVSLVPSVPDAQEVMQETAIALWRKFDKYDPTLPFVPWARQFAYFEVLRFCRDRSKYIAFLSDDLLHLLAREREQIEPLLEERRLALKHCLERLPAADRELIEIRYGSEQTLVEHARNTNQSSHMFRKKLVQIRRKLLDCINRRLATEGTP